MVVDSNSRRRSVDVGGLALAVGNQGCSGRGWVGYDPTTEADGEPDETGTRFAELLDGLYTHANNAASVEFLSDIDMSDETRTKLVELLNTPAFEPHKLLPEEVLMCSLMLFETLFQVDGLQEAAGVSLEQIFAFLARLRSVYRQQNSYHNFEHALDVLQATYHFLSAAGRIPPVTILHERNHPPWRPDKRKLQSTMLDCLHDEDLLCLFIAAIGHDVGHPGFTNNFMKNAKTPLSCLYDDRSALEQMHCTLLLHIMHRPNRRDALDLGHLLHDQCNDAGQRFRKLLLAIVLATDMRVHSDFMTRFERLLSENEPEAEWARRILLCQALIKCADISNPCRPLNISQYWAAALNEEWSSQAALEHHLALEPTVHASADAESEAAGQVFFINIFARPLFDLVSRAVPEITSYAEQCKTNFEFWTSRQAHYKQLKAARAREAQTVEPSSSSADSQDDASSDRPLSPAQAIGDYQSVFPMTLPPGLTIPADTVSMFPSSCAFSEVSAYYSACSSLAPSVCSRPASPTLSINGGSQTACASPSTSTNSSDSTSRSGYASSSGGAPSPLLLVKTVPSASRSPLRSAEPLPPLSTTSTSTGTTPPSPYSPSSSPTDAVSVSNMSLGRNSVVSVLGNAMLGSGLTMGMDGMMGMGGASVGGSSIGGMSVMGSMRTGMSGATGINGSSGAGTEAIRAAYKASVKKKTSFHRNSWNPPSSSRASHNMSIPMPGNVNMPVGMMVRVMSEGVVVGSTGGKGGEVTS